MPSLSSIVTGILIGSVAGIAAGNLPDLHDAVGVVVEYVAAPLSRMWFNALFMMVIPLVVATLAVGVVRVHQGRSSDRGGPAIDWRHTLLSLLAIVGGMVGLALASVVPLDTDRRTVVAGLINAYSTATTTAATPAAFDVDTVLRIVPRNPIQAMVSGDILAVVFFGLLAGVVIAQLPDRQRLPMSRVLDSLVHVCVHVITGVLWLAPAAALFVFFAAAASGITDTFRLATSGLAMVAGLGVFRAVVIAIPRTIAPASS